MHGVFVCVRLHTLWCLKHTIIILVCVWTETPQSFICFLYRYRASTIASRATRVCRCVRSFSYFAIPRKVHSPSALLSIVSLLFSLSLPLLISFSLFSLSLYLSLFISPPSMFLPLSPPPLSHFLALSLSSLISHSNLLFYRFSGRQWKCSRTVATQPCLMCGEYM